MSILIYLAAIHFSVQHMCYELVCVPPNFVETLISNIMVFGDRACVTCATSPACCGER